MIQLGHNFTFQQLCCLNVQIPDYIIRIIQMIANMFPQDWDLTERPIDTYISQ